jgi:hypothetical protein
VFHPPEKRHHQSISYETSPASAQRFGFCLSRSALHAMCYVELTQFWNLGKDRHEFKWT